MYFKIGVQGEDGFIFFLPDNYRKLIKVLGSGIRRTINGTAKRDIITKKHTFELGFEYASEKEYLNFLEVFKKNVDQGKNLIFIDDEGGYDVIWSGESFGLDERKQDEGIFWQGTIFLEEI